MLSHLMVAVNRDNEPARFVTMEKRKFRALRLEIERSGGVAKRETN